MASTERKRERERERGLVGKLALRTAFFYSLFIYFWLLKGEGREVGGGGARLAWLMPCCAFNQG